MERDAMVPGALSSPPRWLWLTVIALVLLGLVTSASQASAQDVAIHLEIKNQRGMPLPDMLPEIVGDPIEFPADYNYTYAQGTVSVCCVHPGDQIQIPYKSTYCNPANLPPDVIYTVPNPVPSGNVPITMANVLGTSFQPQRDDEERWLIGRINQERAKTGAPPLSISTTLTDAADRYASFLAQGGGGNDGHCAAGDPKNRFWDVGWPMSFERSEFRWAENVSGYKSPVDAFENWMSDYAHRTNMLDPKYALAGISHRDDRWVFDVTTECPPSHLAYERCGVTNDHGDVNLNVVEPDTFLNAGPEKTCVEPDGPNPVHVTVTNRKSGQWAAAHDFTAPQECWSPDLGPGYWRVCGTQPSGQGYKSWHKCQDFDIQGRARMSFGQLQLVGDRLQFPLRADSPLVGQEATVTLKRWKKHCHKRHHHRRHCSWKRLPTENSSLALAQDQEVDAGPPLHHERLRITASVETFDFDFAPYLGTTAKARARRR